MNISIQAGTLVSIAVVCSCIVTTMIACDRRGDHQSSVTDSAPGPARPVYVFFDGCEPVAPWDWAAISKPQSNDESAGQLLAMLPYDEVIDLKNRLNELRGESFELRRGVDPTPMLTEHIDTIFVLGRQARLHIEWQDSDAIRLINGETVSGLKVASYFDAISHAMEEFGELGGYERDPTLSDSLLVIGYNLYMSGWTGMSEKQRILILGSAWNAAFRLREVRAKAEDDEGGASLWAARRRELEHAIRHMHKARLDRARTTDPE